jgi:CheY-like chemotaxis protein
MQPSRRRILCVDDHDDTRSMLTLLLGRQGYEAVSAASAGEALDLARSQRFDLYVLDAWLPDGSGLEMCAGLPFMNLGTRRRVMPGVRRLSYGDGKTSTLSHHA